MRERDLMGFFSSPPFFVLVVSRTFLQVPWTPQMTQPLTLLNDLAMDSLERPNPKFPRMTQLWTPDTHPRTRSLDTCSPNMVVPVAKCPLVRILGGSPVGGFGWC